MQELIEIKQKLEDNESKLNVLMANFFTLLEILGKGTIKTSEAAKMIGCSRQTLYNYVEAGIIPAIKKGTHNQFRVKDIIHFLNHQGATEGIKILN